MLVRRQKEPPLEETLEVVSVLYAIVVTVLHNSVAAHLQAAANPRCEHCWLPGMDSNHEETSSQRISKLLILQSATSHESHGIDRIRTTFVHEHPPSRDTSPGKEPVLRRPSNVVPGVSAGRREHEAIRFPTTKERS